MLTLFVLCLLLSRGFSTAPTKTVNLFSNGESVDGFLVTIHNEVANLTSFLGQKKRAKLYGVEGGVEPDRIYNGRGQVISDYAQVIDGESLYVVAPGLRFVWPFVQAGHVVTLEPDWFSEEWRPEAALTLTSVYELPRVFTLTGFFSSKDADNLIRNVEAIEDPLKKLQRSGIGPEITKSDGKKLTSEVRTSSNAFDSESRTAKTLNHRAFELCRIPYDDLLVDGLQILRYNLREAYIPHTDWFPVGTTPFIHEARAQSLTILSRTRAAPIGLRRSSCI